MMILYAFKPYRLQFMQSDFRNWYRFADKPSSLIPAVPYISLGILTFLTQDDRQMKMSTCSIEHSAHRHYINDVLKRHQTYGVMCSTNNKKGS